MYTITLNKSSKDFTLLIKYFILGLMLCLGSLASAKNIYVSKQGNDNNSGTQNSPYKTIAKASSVAAAGDVIIIGQGTYEETLRPQRSGTAGRPIRYIAKSGEKVIISALQSLSGWSRDAGNIYKTKVNWDLGQSNFILNGNTAMDLARWPNNTDGDPFTLNSKRNSGGSGSNTVNNAFLTSSEIPNINWKGGAVFFYGDKSGSGWLAWKSNITSSTTGRVNFNLDKNPTWIRTFHAPKDGGDFYLEGVKGALDYQNEWWFNKNTKELFVIMPNGGAPANGRVKMRRRIVAIDLSGRDYITIENLAVVGGEIHMNNTSDFNTIKGVSSFYGNHSQGVFKGFASNSQSVLMQGKNNTIERCEIAFGSGNGIKVGGADNKILNSKIHDFNYLGSYDAPINARGGVRTKIVNNSIYRGGRDGVQFFNNDSEFAYNDVSQANMIADDCALLYTVGGPHRGEIHHNWFHDNEGRGKLNKAAGIYLDNDAEAFSVHHNVIWNTEWTGVQINWDGKDINVFNNTFYNNSDEMGAWHKEGTSFTNVKVWNNLGFKGEWEPQSNKQNNLITGANAFVNISSGDFMLKAGANAVNKGRVINNITNGYVGSAPDVGAYEYGGDKWRAGITWNSNSGPTGICYGLPGENCTAGQETVAFKNASVSIPSKTSYNFSIDYKANQKREVIVEFWSSTSYLGSSKTIVEAGQGVLNTTIDLATAPTPGSGYIYKTHIRPLNTTWREAIDRKEILDVTVVNQQEKVSFVNPTTQIQQQNFYDFKINYAANQKREIVVEFWSSSSWLGQEEKIVEAGTGSVDIRVNLSNTPPAGRGYIYKVHIRPLNTDWQDAIARDQVDNIEVLNPFTQLISDGTYYITSNTSSQRLLSRKVDNFNARMIDAMNYDDQRWRIIHLGNNIYRIQNIANSRYLEVPYARCSNGSNVATYSDPTEDHKKWEIKANGNGIYNLIPQNCKSRALDRQAGAMNANVHIWDYSRSNENQKWKIIPVSSKQNDSAEELVILEIHPNPVQNQMIIQNRSVINTTYSIHDTNGRLMKQEPLDSNNTIIDVSMLQSGFYFINVPGFKTTKFVKL